MTKHLDSADGGPLPRTDIDFSLRPKLLVPVILLMGLATWLWWWFFARPFPVDSNIPHYVQQSNLAGTIVSVGSDTLTDVMVQSSRSFRQLYPGVTIQLEDKGSGTAPPALIEGRSQLAPMSRLMTEEELHAFEAKYGYPPTAYKIALDALAVYVSRDNPIRQMTIQQLDGLFSAKQRPGGESYETWGSVGLTGDWASKHVELFGRDANSGTHDFFRQHVLAGADFKASVHEDLSQDVVQDVADHVNGVGYSGIGWRTSGVRPVALANKGTEFFEPTYEDSLAGRYPLARFLYIYVNQPPGKPLDGASGEFIKYVLSYEGQQAVVQAKFFPLTAKLIGEGPIPH